MSLSKILLVFTIFLFGIIGILALFKSSAPTASPPPLPSAPVEIEIQVSSPVEVRVIPTEKKTANTQAVSSPASLLPPPEVDRIEELFNKTAPQLPIVQTITYKSRVAWQKGRPAWLSDYASHYTTSRHFIARSLNGEPDYLKQEIAEGDRFNVLHPEKTISFYLLIDISRNKMWFYSIDESNNEKILIKTYNVGLGRVDSSKPSGFLTPLGKYALGNKIATYKPKVTGFHHGQKIEMIQVFGTRWMPFEKEIGECSAPAAGFGIHGVPWVSNAKGELVEDLSSLGENESDGCVRLATKDVEEIFAIVITRPTVVELVKDFYDAK